MNSANSMPIIRLTVEGMQHSIQSALSSYHSSVDQWVAEELDRYINGGEFRRVVDAEVRRASDAAIKRGVDEFFRSGPGYAFVTRAVVEKLAVELREIEASERDSGERAGRI